MVTAGTQHGHAIGWRQAGRINILHAEGKQRAPTITPVLVCPCPCQVGLLGTAGLRHSEGALPLLTAGLAWLAIRFDHFGDQGEGIGEEAGNRLPLQGFPAQQDRFTKPKIVDPAHHATRQQPGQIG